jgi:creatinine amidohydrolase
MRIADMNWMQVEERLRTEDRAVLPLGSTEEHAYLSLATDSVLAERIAVEAAEPLGVPVFPVMSYGITPTLMAYPGTISLRIETYLAVVRDVLDCLAAHGFRRILVVNGHGGNSPAQSQVLEWVAAHPGVRVRFHNWWNAPLVMAKVREIDPIASHASWMENFPWTRLADVAVPDRQKPMIDFARLHTMDPRETREYLGEGSFGGRFARSDAEMEQIWAVAVTETRALLTNEWGT